MGHTTCSTSGSRITRHIYSSLFASTFMFILHSTLQTPSTYSSSITPPYYSFVSHSTDPLILFCYCPQSSVFCSVRSILSITLQRLWTTFLQSAPVVCAGPLSSHIANPTSLLTKLPTRRRHGPSPPTFRSALNPPLWLR